MSPRVLAKGDASAGIPVMGRKLPPAGFTSWGWRVLNLFSASSCCSLHAVLLGKHALSPVPRGKEGGPFQKMFPRICTARVVRGDTVRPSPR